MMNTILKLDVTVERQEPFTGVYDVLRAIRPDWTKDDIVIKLPSQGKANILLMCRTPADPEDVLMVRLVTKHGRLDDFIDRDAEFEVVCMLAEQGIVQPVYCRFTNGYAYKAYRGACLTREDLENNDGLLRRIAIKLHEIQAVVMPDDLLNRRSSPPDQMNAYWSLIQEEDFSDIEQSEVYKNALPPIKDLAKIFPKMMEIYEGLEKKYPTCFAHLDYHVANIIYDKTSGVVGGVDWELCGSGPAIYDPSVFLSRDPRMTEKFETLEDRRKWLKIYLETHPVYGKQPISEELLNEWVVDSLKACLYDTFMLLIMTIASAKFSSHLGRMLGDFGAYWFKQYNKYSKQLSDLTAEKH